MMVSAAQLLVLLAGAYLSAGLLFAVAFAARGAPRIDPAARGTGLGFRLLLVPGAALFWPLLARRWWCGEPPPEPDDAHRRRAGERPSPGEEPA